MKIVFIITDKMYIRNFINTKIIDDIKKKHELILLIKKGVNLSEIKKEKYNLQFYNTDKFSGDKTTYFDILITHHKKKSKYFPFRLRRLYRFDLRFLNEICLQKKININFLNKARHIHILILNLTKFIYYNFISKKPIFNILIKLGFFNYPVNTDFKLKLDQLSPELTIIPSSGYSPEIFDLNNLNKKLNFKYNVIIDNWDNLSSKMIFENSPNKIFVWGDQASIHANKIHKIPKNKIVKIGCARYTNYFLQRNDNSLKNPFDFKYVLFLGSSWSWNEEDTLKELSIIIEKNKKILNGLKIVYRPHPFRQRETDFNINYKNIVYDPQIVEFMKKKHESWPDISYYPGLIKNSLFCMGGLTSMLIESTIFYKKYIAIGYDDNQSLMNQKNALKYFDHLEEIESLPNLIILKNKNEIEVEFMKNVKEVNDNLKKEIDKKRNFFLHHPSEKISNIILKNLE